MVLNVRFTSERLKAFQGRLESPPRKNLKDKIKRTKEKKIELQKCREKMIVDFDMDYKTIEKRLSQEFPEFVEKSTD